MSNPIPKQKSRTLYFGNHGIAGYEKTPFSSTFDFFQFDTIIIEISKLASDLFDQGTITDRSVSRWAARVQQLDNWVSEGHTLVVVLDALWSHNYAHSGRAYKVDPTTYSPFSLVNYASISGDRIEYAGAEKFGTVFTPYLEHLHFVTVLTGNNLTPILKVQEASAGRPARIVGGYVNYGRGTVFFLPQGISPEYTKSIGALRRPEEANADVVPDWVAELRSSEEAAIHSEVLALREELDRISEKVARKQQQVAKISEIKRLLYASGEPFKEAVAEALREVGLIVLDGPHPRADLLATDGRRLLAIEAKGVEGPVREQNVTQAFRWLGELQSTITMMADERQREPDLRRYAEIIEKLGLDLDKLEPSVCRGLVCVSTFRKTPVSERSEPDVPEPVARLLARPQYETIAAITAANLMASILATRRDEQLRPAFVEALFSTTGQIGPLVQLSELFPTLA